MRKKLKDIVVFYIVNKFLVLSTQLSGSIQLDHSGHVTISPAVNTNNNTTTTRTTP